MDYIVWIFYTPLNWSHSLWFIRFESVDHGRVISHWVHQFANGLVVWKNFSLHLTKGVPL